MFLLSADLCQPMHAAAPNVTDFLQIFSFTILALIGLRWALHDHGQRCKQCLRSLASPTPVGRPSHNLLEWSGSELICKRGHGALSIPDGDELVRVQRMGEPKPLVGSSCEHLV
jgi:hypothetical protein